MKFLIYLKTVYPKPIINSLEYTQWYEITFSFSSQTKSNKQTHKWHTYKRRSFNNITSAYYFGVYWYTVLSKTDINGRQKKVTMGTTEVWKADSCCTHTNYENGFFGRQTGVGYFRKY